MTRILALDISANPGVAVLEVKRNKINIVHVDSIKTSTDDSDAARYHYIDAFLTKIIHEYGHFDYVTRENYTGSSRSKRAKQLVYGAWSTMDMSLGKYGYVIDEADEIPASTIKKEVAGKGGASKGEVAEGVFKLFGIDDKSLYYTKNGKLIDDRTDAVALGYTFAKKRGLIK